MSNYTYKLLTDENSTTPGQLVDLGSSSGKHSIYIDIVDPDAGLSALSVRLEATPDKGVTWFEVWTWGFIAAQLAAGKLKIDSVDKLARNVRFSLPIVTGATANTKINVWLERESR